MFCVSRKSSTTSRARTLRLLTRSAVTLYRASSMKILVIGGGGREHAIVWKLRQSPGVEHIWCAPGNGGISDDAECFSGDVKDVKALAALAEKLRADLTLVGPEIPLVLGIAEEFASRGLAIVGPVARAAQLEGSKIFAKQFMQRHKIPTAAVYQICESALDAYTALCEVDWPLVIKADGLAAGKGVLVTSSPDEATAFVERAMEKHEFDSAGNRLLLEEGLRGEELSYIVLTDGNHWMPLAPTRDFKRAFDGDKGPNTGGMGAISDDGLLSADLERRIREQIVEPTIGGLAADKIAYQGFLYFGLMLTAEGPKVLEFNCRLGDPETEALVMRMDFDLAEALRACADRNLKSFSAKWKPGASACVVMASEGYPGSPKIDRRIDGLGRSGNGMVFHAGTAKIGSTYYTCSGRALVAAAEGLTVTEALGHCYDMFSSIHFEGCHYRRDIGKVASPERSAVGAAERAGAE
jgi:phosphoribosylamine--glycine ligase